MDNHAINHNFIFESFDSPNIDVERENESDSPLKPTSQDHMSHHSSHWCKQQHLVSSLSILRDASCKFRFIFL